MATNTAAADAPSDTPIPSTETTQPDPNVSVSEEQWKGMQTVLNNVYAYRTEDGSDPSKLFQRKVNKRAVPDYYTIIKEPMALSIIKQKVVGREYKSFAECARDFALIPHNAQVYNRPDSGAYQDALIIKDVIEEELKKLAAENIITEDMAKLPYIGEIPNPDDVDDIPPEDEEEEEEEEEDEDEEEPDDSDDDGGRRRRRKAPRSTAAITKREGGKDDAAQKANEAESRKKRGRPPRVDTPMEARIKNIMKAMRKPRNSSNQLMISAFERLPDKAAMPDYFNEIKNPMAMDILKKKLKRKKYQSVDQFMKDVEIMFENAKVYNQDESQIYKDAVHLQKEARIAAEQEKKKPDADYVMEDGRLPMPNGILHNGELWKVGDWVHIQNPNDLTKPIVAQIYRTWEDSEGGKWVNACWYYRPEQTVHRHDRYFLENEVVKTGQYRDHRIDEVVDRCFVMFFTRYNKGRPRFFPTDKEIYVCEARYNEEKHKLNKIKTWASCLPDEVREKDYEMDLFDAPRKLKKVPSPIAYLLPKDAKETDPLPEPEWGAENAPPKIGAVHMRPRDPKESPPPEPTPSPPPQPPPSAPRQLSNISTPAPSNYGIDQRSDYKTSVPPVHTPLAHTPVQPSHSQPAYTPQPQHTQHFNQHSASPVPAMQPLAPSQPSSFPPSHMNFQAPMPTPPPGAQYATPQSNSTYHQSVARPPHLGYKTPQPIEVYRLSDVANASIPPEIRAQFQCDEQGHVLFFTAPPIDAQAPAKESAALGHSLRYRAARLKRNMILEQKRKREAETAAETEEARKKQKMDEEKAFKDKVEGLLAKSYQVLEDQMFESMKQTYETLYGDQWKPALRAAIENLTASWEESAERNKRLEEKDLKKLQKEYIPITGVNGLLELVTPGK